jgi:hypothetical protein
MIHKKQLDNVEYFKYLGNPITNDETCTREIKPRTAKAKPAINKEKAFSPANWN